MNNNQLKDAAAIQQWILRKLGAPLLKVELIQDHLDDCVEDARRWFSAKKGFKQRATLPLGGSQYQYQLPDDVDTVLDVQFTANGNDIDRIVDPLALVDGFPASAVGGSFFSGAGSNIGLLSSYAQMTQYLHTAKQVLGAEMEWWQENDKLIVLPPPKNGAVRIEYKSNSFTVEQLTERDHDLVKRMALARAKETLGRIRSKFDQYPTAQGSVTMDGAALLEEARNEIEALDEEIGQSGYPLGFMRG